MTVHSTRDRESRSKQGRQDIWRNPGKMDTPDAPEGYAYRWVRFRKGGEDDYTSIRSRLKQGYEVVTAAELGDDLADVMPGGGRFEGAVIHKDVMLMKVAEPIKEQRIEYYQEVNDRLDAAVRHEYESKGDPRMPFRNERRSSVSVGRGRKASFED